MNENKDEHVVIGVIWHTLEFIILTLIGAGLFMEGVRNIKTWNGLTFYVFAVLFCLYMMIKTYIIYPENR